MKHIQPNHKDEETKSNELRQGEEIVLGIEPKSEEESNKNIEDIVNNNDTNQYQPIKKIHHRPLENDSNIAKHAQGDFIVSQQPQNNPEIDVEIQKHPLIDLTPQTEQGVSAKKSARQKLNELRKHKHWHNAKLVVATVLVFLLIFNSQWFISQFIYLFNRPKAQNTTQQPQTQPAPAEEKKDTQAEVVGPQNEIIIPKIGVRAPLVFINTTNEADVLFALRDGVVHYYGTALPGENGNAAFFGHSSNDWWEPGNFKFVFVLLEKLTVGDTYEIHYNSRKYVYQVTQTKVVQPNDLSVLNQTSEPTSTLITCTPPGTSWQRFVVSAKQISPVAQKQEPTPAPAPTSNTQTSNQSLPSAPPSIWQQISNFVSTVFGNDTNKNKPANNQDKSQKHLPEVN